MKVAIEKSDCFYGEAEHNWVDGFEHGRSVGYCAMVSDDSHYCKECKACGAMACED